MFEGISPFMIVLGFNILVAIAGLVYIILDKVRTKMKIYHFSENEKLFDIYNVDAFSPNALYSNKEHMRFFRHAPSYKSRAGNTIMWLAKRGTGYLFRLEDTTIEVKEKNEDGEVIKKEIKQVAKKLGTLWDGLQAILTPELCEQFSTEVKERLMKPDIFLTVELESGKTPDNLPDITEEDIYNETATRMSGLIFSGIKEAMKEDYMKILLTLGCGVGACLVLIRLGVL